MNNFCGVRWSTAVADNQTRDNLVHWEAESPNSHEHDVHDEHNPLGDVGGSSNDPVVDAFDLDNLIFLKPNGGDKQSEEDLDDDGDDFGPVIEVVQPRICDDDDNRFLTTTLSLEELKGDLFDMQARRVIEPYEIQDREVMWTNPEVGMYKCNVDVAF
ncbi:hypothetical protein JHK82_028014 [Glycine max]|nr:hypothetical protein JHK82_028014 [Glycine max]